MTSGEVKSRAKNGRSETKTSPSARSGRAGFSVNVRFGIDIEWALRQPGIRARPISLHAAAQRLNARGIASPRGARWAGEQLMRMGRRPIQHPAAGIQKTFKGKPPHPRWLLDRRTAQGHGQTSNSTDESLIAITPTGRITNAPSTSGLRVDYSLSVLIVTMVTMAQSAPLESTSATTTYRRIPVDGVNVFCREAGLHAKAVNITAELLMHQNRPVPSHTKAQSRHTQSEFVRRSLALRPAHSRCHRISWHAHHRRLQPFRYLHSCSGCFRLELSPGGTFTHWESAAFARRTPGAVPQDGPLRKTESDHGPPSWGTLVLVMLLERGLNDTNVLLLIDRAAGVDRGAMKTGSSDLACS